MSVCPACSHSHICANKNLKETQCMYQKSFKPLPDTVDCPRCEGDGYASNGFRCNSCRGSGLVIPVTQAR